MHGRLPGMLFDEHQKDNFGRELDQADEQNKSLSRRIFSQIPRVPNGMRQKLRDG